MNGDLSNELTVIIPIDLRFRHRDIIKKASLFARHASKAGVRVIFGVSSPNDKVRREFLSEFEFYTNVVVTLSTTCTKNVNSSMLRNLAFEKCETKYIALLDVDIFPDFLLLGKYLKYLSDSIKPFYILPCLYLTQSASVSMMKGRVTTETLKCKFFSYSRKEFLHLACPSSLTLMHAEDYLLLNGFDINFEGHGYEDFDFLIRLSRLHNLLEDKQDLFIDKTSRSPLFSVGFRKYLGKLCFEQLANKDIAFHLFHPKDGNSSYHKLRAKNKIIFMKKYADNNIISVNEEFLIVSFLEYCQNNNFDILDYSILFDNKPGHIDRYDTFRRRIKFLFNE
ncbi:capsular biosynthesis protein [Escherichia coli]|nr:capsular biosynthesis protein [Escherichia coli]ELU9779301.1 capsular biosynthesis protein [Escherichia coli]HAN8087018.1 capsular biosynthesis protein [Escherichia coli]